MFDVGFAELFLLALIGLIVLGPERLPAVARTIGGFVSKARASWVSLRNTIESELAEADISAPIKEAGEEFRRIGKDLNSNLPNLSDISGFTETNTGSKTVTDTDAEPNNDSDPGDDSSDNLSDISGDISSENKISLNENPDDSSDGGKDSNA